MKKLTHNYLLCLAVGAIFLIGVSLSATVFADNTDIVDNIGIEIPTSCTMTGTGMNTHTASIPNGTSNSSIGETNITAFCNDNSGFAIYAVGYTDDEYGKNVLSNHTLGSNYDISTGLQVTGSDSNWAMKLSTITDPTPTYPISIENNFNSFHTVPTTYTMVAKRNESTDSGTNAIGSSFKTTYQAYISNEQPSGLYKGQVKYVLVHPSNNTPQDAPIDCPANSICYGASANDIEGTMGVQTKDDSNNNITTGATVTLLATNFSRKGYGFTGWSESQNAVNDPNAKIYGPQETITTRDLTTKGMSLYAVWVKSVGSLQDQSKVAELCGTGVNALVQAPTDGTANITSVSALTDQRDNQTYAIAKLADGKCWMIENLRLEAEYTIGYYYENLAQGYASSTTYGSFIGLPNSENSNFSNSATANSVYYSGVQSGSASINIGTGGHPAYRMPRYNNLNTNNRASNPISNQYQHNTDGGMYSYGNYYTWPAALANTIFYSSATATDTNGNTSETAGTSLCPSGWALPYGRDTGRGSTAGGFYNLNYALNNDVNVTDSVASEKARSYPNNLLLSGYYYLEANYFRGVRGYYWSSTDYTENNSYEYYMTSSEVYPGTHYGNSYNGASIRCVTTLNA